MSKLISHFLLASKEPLKVEIRFEEDTGYDTLYLSLNPKEVKYRLTLLQIHIIVLLLPTL